MTSAPKWLFNPNIRPTGESPGYAKKIAADITTIMHMLKKKFPNLRVACLNSRIYAGCVTMPLNPEPLSCEGAFVMRWLIQNQIKGTRDSTTIRRAAVKKMNAS